MAYMDYMDLTVRCSRKAVKLNHSFTSVHSKDHIYFFCPCRRSWEGTYVWWASVRPSVRLSMRPSVRASVQGFQPLSGKVITQSISNLVYAFVGWVFRTDSLLANVGNNQHLTCSHLGRVMHLCISNLGHHWSNNGLLPTQCRASIRTNASSQAHCRLDLWTQFSMKFE